MDNGTLRLFLYLLLFLAGGAAYSMLLSYFTKNWVLRYLPSLISLLLIPYLVYNMYFGNLEGFLPLAYFIFALTVFAVMVGNVLANLLFDRRQKKKTA